MKFQVLRFLSLILYVLLGCFTSRHWQLLRSYSVNVRQMNGCAALGELILRGKNQNTQRKTWPSATPSTTNPIWVCSTGRINTEREKSKHSEKNLAQCHSVHHKSHTDWPTSVCVLRGPGLTVRAIYLQWEKWPKNAFYCTDQFRCAVLHVACVTNAGCVLFERLCNRNCHTAVLSQVGYVGQISHT